jgi:MATE family multidrug resistance protein
MVALRVSRGQHADAGRMVSNALLCAFVLGLATMLLLFSHGRTILGMFATNNELMGPALTYLIIRAVSVPALLVSTVCTAACLGQRDPVTPLKVAGLAGVFNVVFDVFLVLGPPQV